MRIKVMTWTGKWSPWWRRFAIIPVFLEDVNEYAFFEFIYTRVSYICPGALIHEVAQHRRFLPDESIYREVKMVRTPSMPTEIENRRTQLRIPR